MTQQQQSDHISEAKKMVPGDELHLTLLMAPFSLNFFTGQDRQHLLAFGRAAFEAGQAAAQQAVQAAVPVAWRLTNTAFRKPRFEYHDTKESAEQRQADFNRSVDDGGLHNLTPLYAAPARPSDGVPQVSIEKLEDWKRRVNTLATCGLKADRYRVGSALKQEIADAITAQPAAQGMEAQQYRLIQRGELIEAGDQFLRDDFTWQIDPRGIFVGVPHGAALRPARRALAAQAKQAGAANG